MIVRFFITCLVLCFSAIYALKAQVLVADFPFDDPNDVLNNTVPDQPDGIALENPATTQVGTDPATGNRGLYNSGGENDNIDVRLPTRLFDGITSTRIEIDFQNQESFTNPMTTREIPDGFVSFSIAHLTGSGFKVNYSTENNFVPDVYVPPITSGEGFIGPSMELGERATLVFTYNQETGIAKFFKDDVLLWETPEDETTPGAGFSLGNTNQTADGEQYFLVGAGIDGQNPDGTVSTIPSLYNFRIYDRDCPDINAPNLESVGIICGSGSTNLVVSGADSEQEYRWFNEDGEELVDENGNVVTGDTFTTPVLTQTTTYGVAIFDDPCLGDTLKIEAVVNPKPNAPIVEEPDPECEPTAFTLNVTDDTEGTYQWYKDNNGVPELLIGENQATYETDVLPPGTTLFYVSAVENGCLSDPTEVSATVLIPPPTPTVDPVTLCQPGETTLQVNNADEFTYRWYDQPTGGPLLAENDGAFTTTISAATTFYVSAQSGVCESDRVPLEVSLAERPEAPQASDLTICEAGPASLTATGGTDGNYRWYEGDSDEPITGAVNGTFSPTIAQTTTYSVAITNGTCESDRIPVTVTILSEVAPPSVDGPESCTPTAFDLEVSEAAAGNTYRWYAADGTTVLSEGPARYTTDVLNESTDYYVAQVVGDCEGERTLVRATLYAPVPAPAAQPVLLCEPGEAVLRVDAPDNNTLYRWYRGADGQTSTGMLAETEGTLRLDIADNTTLYVSAWNGTCESDRTPITVGILETPDIDAGADTRILPGDQITLNAPAGFVQYQWSPREGLDNPNIRQPTATPTRTTTYYLTVTTDQDCELTSTVTVTVADRLPIPNAFTPNGDGLNDTWDMPFLRKYPQSQVQIYNRWGSLVFQSEEGYEQAWDGFYQGSVVPQGTYTYVLNLGNGQKPTRGILTVIQ